jgi:bifunctional non-homologous end joining protein LigD
MAKSRSSGTERKGSSRLAEYEAKRDFAATPEPVPNVAPPTNRPAFVVQKHDATRLHYDVRLEIDGAMMSFAVPRGPSYDPAVKRFAVETEDHPLEYNKFEGRIPDGHYGAGDVLIWDAGTYETVPPGAERAMRTKGHLRVRFFGEKLEGEWHFVRMKRDRSGRDAKNQWLFFKADDKFASKTRDVVSEEAASIVSGKSATRGPMRKTSNETVHSLLEIVGEPMQAMNAPLDDPSQYTFEVKFDGYRMLAARANHEVRLESRRGHSWTERFPPVAEAIAALPIADAVIDGEVCAVTSDGKPSFQRLQQWAQGERPDVALAFAVFDLLWLDGRDLRPLPIEERRALLKALVEPHKGVIAFSANVDPPLDGLGRPDVPGMMEMCRRAGLEGFIAKRKGTRYHNGKASQWVKLKCIKRQEVAIVGYTPMSGSKASVVGGLILAVADSEGRFHFAGKVGSGLDDRQRKQYAAMLEKDRIDEPPIVLDEKIKDARWSTPRYCAEVSFLEWSDDGKMRHPLFVGLREDKTPADCRREDERPPLVAPSSRVKLKNADKVLYPRDGITKQEIFDYYEAISSVMLPHLRGRPLTMQRYPDGIDGEAWYQHRSADEKYFGLMKIDGKAHVTIHDADGLRWAANLAALTLHQWSAHDDLDAPDYTILDLDPGEGPWEHVIDVALAARVLLDKLELPSFVKTTGKRGLHIVVPIARGASHDEATKLAELLATAISRVLPDKATIERSIPKRKGRLYVDFLQNGRGKTIASPYTLRAIDGARVSTPLRWSEITKDLDPSRFTLRTVRPRVEAHGDLFAPVLRGGPDIRGLLARLR